MKYNSLYILLEGNDDKRFFERIMKPEFEKRYKIVAPWKYAQEKREKVQNFINSVKALNADYIYVTDINSAPCVTARKQEIGDKLRDIDRERIVVVIKEIEGWYLAGLDSTSSKKLGIHHLDVTDNITKSEFDHRLRQGKKFDSKISYMLEILNCFDIDTAKQKNRSFKYFAEKYK